MSIIGTWTSLIRLMLFRDNVISRLVFIATQVILKLAIHAGLILLSVSFDSHDIIQVCELREW